MAVKVTTVKSKSVAIKRKEKKMIKEKGHGTRARLTRSHRIMFYI
jgi:hypothetical protein